MPVVPVQPSVRSWSEDSLRAASRFQPVQESHQHSGHVAWQILRPLVFFHCYNCSGDDGVCHFGKIVSGYQRQNHCH